jgi:hypothetical protein
MRNVFSALLALFAVSLGLPAFAGDALDAAQGTAVQEGHNRGGNSNQRGGRGSNGHHGHNGNHNGHHGNPGPAHPAPSHPVVVHPAHPVIIHGGGPVHYGHPYPPGPHYVVRYSAPRVVLPPPPHVVIASGHPRPVIIAAGGPAPVDEPQVVAPASKAGRVSIGIGPGLFGGQAWDGSAYANFGVDTRFRYRILDPLGVELALGFYNDLRPDARRTDVPLQASAMLHTPSRIPVGLFLLGGMTVGFRDYDLTCIGGDHLRGGIVGAHIGGGANLNLGPRATLEWDLRATRFFGRTGFEEGGTLPTNLSSTVTVNLFF